MALYGETFGGGGGGGGSPPVVTNMVQPLSRVAYFECDVTVDELPADVTVLVSLGSNPTEWLVAYADGAFRGVFRALSSVTGTGADASPLHFRVRPASGWPVGSNTVRVR